MAVPRLAVFLDFDGTITTRDATDAILEAFADPEWLRVEEAWKHGRIGSRECLAAQMALVTATTRQIDDLLATIDVDPGLTKLLARCAVDRTPVHIVSDGFDYCIERILRRPALRLGPYLDRIQIVSSHLEAASPRWKASFASFERRCTHGCATCKPAAIDQLKIPGALTVFAGDGLSDRYAVERADLVFAKDALADFCDDRSIPYTRFETLAEIAEAFDLARAETFDDEQRETPGKALSET